ncbi:ABC transporter substrate-binding protein [Pseudomonas sp. SCB32]|uniref:ABC transporter substrate-binding protein n=1 Tax=Pseudomonas sp. SCB32 TaxID=2653853 RepID=UPI001264B720|nr:ABC transporter substrate-binding protein [Pseudomonas sp. SCB32]
MKKSILMAIALVGAIGFQTASARPLDEIQKSGTIVIGTDGTFPPFQYFDGGKLTGFEIDLGNEIAKRMNVKVEWKPMAFDSLLAGLSQDRWDLVIASFGVTPERAKAVDFTNPHYCTGGIIVSTRPDIKSAADLNGKTVSVQTGSTYFEAVQKVPGIKQVRNLSSDNDARNALISGRANAWITDKFVALTAQAKGSQIQGSTHTLYLGNMLFDEEIATAVKKGNSPLLDKYNSVLKDILDDGTYAAISQKWFNEDVRCKGGSTSVATN